MRIHELKIDPIFFEDVRDGRKTFEVRKNDRGFEVGDLLGLNEYDAKNGTYTGESCLVRASYILDDPAYCKEGCVVLGIERMKIVSRDEFEMILREAGLACRAES